MKEIEENVREQGGYSAVFESLVQPHLQMAFRTAFLIIHDYHLAQDAVQEALLEAYQYLHRFDERKGTSFRAWFMKIVTHRALNLARRKKPLVAYEDSADPANNPLENVLQREEERQIWEAIQTMKPVHRSAIVLYYYEGFNVAEIAKILGVFQGTVKSRLHNARQLIAARMKANHMHPGNRERGVMIHE